MYSSPLCWSVSCESDDRDLLTLTIFHYPAVVFQQKIRLGLRLIDYSSLLCLYFIGTLIESISIFGHGEPVILTSLSLSVHDILCQITPSIVNDLNLPLAQPRSMSPLTAPSSRPPPSPPPLSHPVNLSHCPALPSAPSTTTTSPYKTPTCLPIGGPPLPDRPCGDSSSSSPDTETETLPHVQFKRRQPERARLVFCVWFVRLVFRARRAWSRWHRGRSLRSERQ